MSLLGFICINSSSQWIIWLSRLNLSWSYFALTVSSAKLKLYFIINLMPWLLAYSCKPFILTTWKIEVSLYISKTEMLHWSLFSRLYLWTENWRQNMKKIHSILRYFNKKRGSHCLGTGWASVSRWLQLHCASLLFYILIIIVTSLPFSVVLNFISSHEFYPFSYSLPHPTKRDWVSSSVVFSCLLA